YGKIMNQLENDTSKSVKELSKSLTGSLRSKGGGSVIVKNELVKGTDAKIIFEDNFSKIKGKDLAKHGGLFTEKDEETRKHIIGNASKKGTVANELREAMKDSEFKQSFLLNASTAVKKGAVEAGILLDENRISEIKQKTILTPEEDSILRNQEQLNARK
ncbi:hypothetical protein KAU11_12840, partial [Candidatus Babeliales bacterium]|nr:hypothetical protein [Candidatus Babeliales bacterium]